MVLPVAGRYDINESKVFGTPRSHRGRGARLSRHAGLLWGKQKGKKTVSEANMSPGDVSSLSSDELSRRIAILRDNIRQITAQATTQSGAADEERNAERLWRQNEELESLLSEQERRSAEEGRKRR
jgi:uncharacterized small protein (DUF1192 family)